VKYGFIGEHRKQFPITAMCRVLEVSVSGYYRWRSRARSKRAQENERLLSMIQALHKESRQNYGSPKVYRRLRQQGETCNHKRVERLMREHAIKAKRVKKFKVTADSRHNEPVAENVLDRGFRVNEPDKVWVSDITYLRTAEGWLYLAIFLDLFSRMVVGWSMSERITSELVVSAFEMGQKRRGVMVSPLVHSDRGSQYASSSFRQELAAHNCIQSMSRRGNCWDNAVAESFFSALKLELVVDERFQNRQEARDSIFEYIEVFYNRSRIHSATDYLSPAEYEEQFKRAA
jgi:transposase InsO family protein